jgi:hypothetical protein
MADNEKREQEEKAAKAAAKELALAEGNGMECPVCCEDELVVRDLFTSIGIIALAVWRH